MYYVCRECRVCHRQTGRRNVLRFGRSDPVIAVVRLGQMLATAPSNYTRAVVIAQDRFLRLKDGCSSLSHSDPCPQSNSLFHLGKAQLCEEISIGY